MTAIQQVPTNQPLVGITGHPFALTVAVTVSGTGTWTDLSSFAGLLLDRTGALPAYAPTVTSPSTGVISVVWSAAQTALMGSSSSYSYELDCNLFSIGPYGLVAGTFTLNAPGTPGSSTSASANLTVTIGGTSLALAVSLGGSGGGSGTGDMLRANNLSDVLSASTSRTNLGLGTAATQATGAFDAAGAAAAAQAASQPLDSDLTAIAALTTAPTGRSLLAATNAAGIQTIAGTVIGTNVQAWDTDLDALAALAAAGVIVRTGSGTVSARTITGTANLVTVTNGDGVSGNPTLTVGSNVYVSGGTDVAIADGGTGASTAAAGLANLGGLPVVELVNAGGNTGTSKTIPDVTTATTHTYTLTGNCTFTMPTAAAGKSFTVLLTQDGTGGRTATFTGAKWAGGTAPTITAGIGKIDLVSFACLDGSNWIGSALQDVR